jgi:exopolysaccharide biosynthesis polyprenyl glycosylphosphotransferase
VVLHELKVDTVVFCGQASEATFARVVKTVMAAECRLLTAARTFELAGVRPSVVWRRGQPFIELREVAFRGQQMILKRLLDMICSGMALLLLSPLMAALAIAVRLDSRGPAVFGQARLGRHGRVFKCLKFRSMHTNAEQLLRADAELYDRYVKNDFKLPEAIDKRITRLGRFLRRTSLDELPQLWNVFRGDMSLVGPRPIVVDELRHYDKEEPLFLSLKPGITGAWQVNGRSSVAYPARASLELEYVQTWSLGKDLSILARTIPAVLTQRGAH